MSAHTPGPWVAVEGTADTPPAGCVQAVQRAGLPYTAQNRICDLIAQGDGRYDPKVTSANGYLIAAAPELLASLRKTLAAANELHGQGIGCPHCPADHEETGEDCAMLVAAEAAIAKAEGPRP